MKALSTFASALALGGAFLLVNPGTEAVGFSLTGEFLGVGQRDFRVFNNFADPTANDNMATKIQFPGALGAEQAIWKSCVEWGSTIHGTGQGDPTQSVGDGGANFDAFWCGNATAIGNTDHNVISAVGSCTNGVLGFTELPASNGWRIRFCDNQWVWDDGPGNIGNRWDIQETMTHEYGHALGLGHSAVGPATMFASGTFGSTATRSIHPDDIEGVKFVYGVADPNKPVICQTVVSGNTLTITGSKFTATNDVWLTRRNPTLASISDPRVRVLGVPSTNNGTQITITIPAAAGPGDCLVKTTDTGGKSLSNAFPVDMDLLLAGGVITSPTLCSFTATTMTPNTIPALDPGTAESVTVSGIGFLGVTSIDWNGAVISSSRYTIVDDATITIDMPLGGVLGSGNTLNLHTASGTSSLNFTMVEPSSPVLELGTGDPGNVIPNGGSMNIVVAGTVGTTHQIFYSPSNVPSIHPAVDFDIGNAFTQLQFGAVFTVGPNGYKQFTAPVTFAGGSPKLFYSQSVDVTTPPAPKFATSNVQSVTLTP